MNKKKIKKTLLKIFIVLIIITILTFQFDKINGANDISKLNKICILDVNDKIIYEENNSHQASYVTLNDVDKNFINSLLSIEDKNFYRHYGFDVYRITRVFFTNIFKKEKRGASTITQQYVKNLYLSNHKTYIRKIKEFYLANRLENIYTKDEILEGYLNTIYFSHNIYGLKDASLFYFNKNPNKLNYNEIALLIALLKAPNTYSPIINYEKSMNRKNEILKILYKDKVITENEYKLYSNTNLKIHGKKYQHYSSEIMYFKDIVLNEFYNSNFKVNFNETYTIHTSYNSDVNSNLQQYITINNYNNDASVVILDKQGYYVSCIGGVNYYKNGFNIAINGDRDIGSTIKPLLYYEALNSGFNPLTTFKSEKTTFYINNDTYTISNYNEIYENKKITMAYAMATSDNIYAIKTHLYIGMNKLVNRLKSFDVNSEKKAILALGNVSMSLAKLTSIYNTFSTLGYYNEPKAIKSITVNDKIIYMNKPKNKKILNSTTTYVLNDLMTQMFDTNLNHKVNVTGSSISPYLNAKTAGKSGLTDYDSYMIGFNPEYTIGVWSGYNDNTLLENSIVKGLPKQMYKIAVNNLMQREKDTWYKCPSTVTMKLVDPTLFNTGYRKNLSFYNS